MPAVVEMLPCVPMRRGVAAADVTAGQAQAQMHPPRANSQAILATIGARDDVVDHVQMWVGHFASPPSSNPKHDVAENVPDCEALMRLAASASGNRQQSRPGTSPLAGAVAAL
jgi:hypothetical protein